MEERIKQFLIDILKKDFTVIDKIQGTHYSGKIVRPDLAFKVPNSEFLFIVEIKDDRLKNFELSELLRQAINYKCSKYDGIIPVYCLVATTNMLSKSHSNIRDPLFDLANKLGVGSIYTKSQGRILQMAVGSQVFFRYSLDTAESEINLHKVVDLIVGTKAKTNRMKSI